MSSAEYESCLFRRELWRKLGEKSSKLVIGDPKRKPGDQKKYLSLIEKLMTLKNHVTSEKLSTQ